jgi:uncharacterized protein YgiM (DUF1202 family)
MESKFGFTLFDPTEFDTWIKTQNVARTVLYVQMHHTYIPAYEHFKGNNHFEMQRGMQHVHKVINGWSDIAQQFTIFPDGKIITGRSLERTPSCIFGFNTHSICIENIGNFDDGGDLMKQEQRSGIIKATTSLVKRFNIPINSDKIVYHHWFDLKTGERTNGKGITKSCPGTAFFGGNTVEDANANFIPLVKTAAQGTPIDSPLNILFYGSVTADVLNVRNAPATSGKKINAAELGAILRIYEVKNNWLRISARKQEWVFANFVQRVERGTVNTDSLNVRTGPSTDFRKIGSVSKNQDVFVYETVGDWIRISTDQQWVSRKLVTFAV